MRTTKRCELLWQLQMETANEIEESQQSEIDTWLDEQAEVAYAKDLASAIHLLEQQLSARGFSLKTH